MRVGVRVRLRMRMWVRVRVRDGPGHDAKETMLFFSMLRGAGNTVHVQTRTCNFQNDESDKTIRTMTIQTIKIDFILSQRKQ